MGARRGQSIEDAQLAVNGQRKNALTRNRLAQVRDRQRLANLDLLVEFIVGRVLQQVASGDGSDVNVARSGHGHGVA